MLALAASSVPSLAQPGGPDKARDRNQQRGDSGPQGQRYGDNRGNADRGRENDNQPANNRRKDQGIDTRDFRNFDHNRPGAGGRYYADNYYRSGDNYRPSRISRNTRIYRGRDGRYYCRRADGTTGFIVGAAIGGIFGNRLGDGDSAVLSTLLGAGAGGLLGREIDRGNVNCR